MLASLALAAEPPVGVGEVVEQPVVRVVRVNGTVTSPRSAVLSPSVGGLIAELGVDAGDRVEPGDVLVRLDAELARLALERSLAAEAQARAALDDARRRLTEAERLGSERSIAETEVKSRRAEVTADEAALRAATAEVRRQRAIVDRHEVRAPFGGVVSLRIAELGEWVNPGDGLLELVATEGLRFDFRVPQDYYPGIDEGTGVTVRLDAVPGLELEGRIQAVVPVKDPSARTFLLRVVSEDAGSGLATPGMSAHGALFIDTGRRGIVVPRDALLRYPDGRTTVWVVETGGEPPRVRERRVETGLEFEGLVEIRSGIEAGALVVTRGNEALQDGQAVSLRRTLQAL